MMVPRVPLIETLNALDWPGGSGTGVRRMVVWEDPAENLYPSSWLYWCRPFEKKQSGGNGTTSRTISGTHYWTGWEFGNREPDGGAYQATLPSNGIFQSGSGGATRRYAMFQPYPSPAPNGDSQFQEVSAFQADTTNGDTTAPRWGQDNACFAVCTNVGGSNRKHDFYYDAIADDTKLITVTSSWSDDQDPQHKTISIGQSTWNSYTDNHEEFCGWMWGFSRFQAALTLTQGKAILACTTNAQVLAYCAANGLSSALKFLSVNPTRNDGGSTFLDYSGNSNHGLWIDAGILANRPAEVRR